MMPIMFAVPWEGLFVVVAAVVVALFVCSVALHVKLASGVGFVEPPPEWPGGESDVR